MFSDIRSAFRTAALLAVSFLTFHHASWARERILLDEDWRFHLGDVNQGSHAEFSDANWRTVILPHDWSIEGKTAKDAPSGRDGGYFPTGIGWYRRTFTPDELWRDQRVEIEFEGVYQDVEVWINGERLGFHAYGYTPFTFDLTPHLKFSEQNVIAVRVDNSQQPNSRWYSGSGIYRHVWLHVFDPLHFQPAKTRVTTKNLAANGATLNVTAVVENNTDRLQSIEVGVAVYDPNGAQVFVQSLPRNVPVDADVAAGFTLAIPRPRLWTAEAPNLYACAVSLSVDGQVRDELRIPFGIRTVQISPESGLEINGEKVLLYGGCIHHDNGPLGAAAFDRAEARKVELMKAAGYNAVRTAHNPPSVAFLDACDRLGLYVIDEAFDGWAEKKTAHDYSRVFNDEWQRDLDTMVLRDRQHPAIIMWSIGNEVYERGKDSGRKLAGELSERVRRWDQTRLVTAGINGLGKPEEWTELDPFFAHLDVAGYNYELHRHAKDHQRAPQRVMFASESYQSETFQNWATMMAFPYVIGDFVWTAIDYLGEADIGRVFPPDTPARGHWEGGNHHPWHGAYCGDIDLAGWRKPISHYRQIVWDRGEKLYACVLTPSPSGKPWNLSKWSMPPALPSWTWPGREGKELEVEVYSRYDKVTATLNGKVIGSKPTGRNQEFKATFKVPYEPGTLRVEGTNSGGGKAEVFELVTAGPPAELRLTPDRTTITADGQDLSLVTVEVVDDEGQLYPLAESSVKFEITGSGAIAAVGSGDVSTGESYQVNPRQVYQGRALVVVRSTPNVGKITLTATAAGLAPATAEIEAISAR